MNYSWRTSWIVMLLLCSVLVVDQLAGYRPMIFADFFSFYYAAKAAAQGLNMYEVETLTALANADHALPAGKKILPYLYPPVLAVLFRPLAALPWTTAGVVWMWVNLLTVAASGAAAISLVAGNAPVFPVRGNERSVQIRFGTVVVALLLPVLASRSNIRMGQVNAQVALFMVLFLLSYCRNRASVLAGIWLSVAIAIKVTPAILALILLIRRDLRPLAGLAIGGAALVVVTLLAGAADQWKWFIEFLPATGYGKHIAGIVGPGQVWNISLAGFFSRLFGEGSPEVGLLTLLSSALLCAGVAVSVVRARTTEGCVLLVLPLSIVMVIAAPYAWYQHAIFLLPGLAVQIVSVWRDHSRLCRLCIVLPMFGLAAIGGVFMEPIYRVLLGPINLNQGAVTSVSLYALLGLYVLGMVVFWRHQRMPPPCQPAKRVACHDTPTIFTLGSQWI